MKISSKEIAKFTEKNMHLYYGKATKIFESFENIRTQVLVFVKYAQKTFLQMYKMYIDTKGICC